MEHQDSSFDQELADLNDSLLKMGVMVKDLIHKSVDALKRRDRDLARQVIKDDVDVDQLELVIDDKAINLIALRQPKAGDLRFILAGMRLATDLERIGDLAESIAERCIELADQPLVKPLVDIPRMAELAEGSLSKVLDAFVNRDPDKAKEIWPVEQKIDDLRDRVHDELIEIMSNSPNSTHRAIPLLLAARHLERIGDHITNIAEDIVYMVEGEVIKHGGML
ncbi:MAG: phosphate signaling complex protein PhoU [Candidatus Margulisiibacteriota bacterium]